MSRLPLNTPKMQVLARDDLEAWNMSSLPKEAPGSRLDFVTNSGAIILEFAPSHCCHMSS